MLHGRQSEKSPASLRERHGPKTFHLAFERMQPKTRHIHICHGSGRVEPRENIAQLNHLFSDRAARVVVFVKASQPLVAYGSYHPVP
jgi:hypothetical protein